MSPRKKAPKYWSETFPRCTFCGEDNALGLEVWGHDWQLQLCCERLQDAVEGELALAHAVGGEEECDALRAELLERVACGAVPVRGVSHAKLNHPLRLRVLQGGENWRMARDYVAAHHIHHQAPQGWKFGIGCWNGPTLVGVAIVGRPVSRMLQKAHPDWLEVTRNCTTSEGSPGLDEWAALRREASSQLYLAAVAEAGRRGYARIVTYTLATEHATSVQMARFKKDRAVVSKGGSWDRPSRGREVGKAPACAKVRWGCETAAAVAA